jgi:hypothetical protein
VENSEESESNSDSFRDSVESDSDSFRDSVEFDILKINNHIFKLKQF